MAITKVSPGLLDLDSGITITTADNTAQLQLISTDADANSGPQLDLYRNSGSPADGDDLGRIYFYGENDADEKIEMVLMRASIVDASDSSEDSSLQLYTYVGGSQADRLTINSTEIVLNESSKDVDFRVETDANTHGLYVDSTANRVSIGGDGSVTRGNPKLLVELGNFNYVEIKGAADSTANGLLFSDGGSGTAYGVVGYNHASDYLNFYSASTQRLRVDADGVKFGTDSAAANALDDYEEGTWSPQFKGYGGNNATQSVVNATYTKIGNTVHCVAYINNIDLSAITSGTYIVIDNFPFVATGYGDFSTAYRDGTHATTAIVGGYIQSTADHAYLVGTNGVEQQQTGSAAITKIMLNVTYKTTA